MNKQQILEDLKEFAIPRHSKWDPLGLMSIRIYIKERLSFYGDVIEHSFKEGSEGGVNYILKFPGHNPKLDPLLIGAHYDGRKILDLHPRNHKPLDQHLKGILQWRPSNPIRKMNYMDA